MKKSYYFIPRDQLAAYEWQGTEKWARPDVAREVMKEQLERNTFNGLWRLGFLIACLALTATTTLYAAQYSPWLAIPCLYGYYFFYGFWVAPGHELQHKTVFASEQDWLNEIFFYIIQVLMWNPPTFARKSHQLHHRYTMVRGMDPETDWPEVITTKWLRNLLFVDLIGSILFIGAFRRLWKYIVALIKYICGYKTPMMVDYCNDQDNKAIRREAAGILLFHAVNIAISVYFQRWELFFFITIAWQVGAPIEELWHSTEHISRMYDANDQRLATRSIKVNPFVRMIYWGLDDHIDHHMFPNVPSRNLPRLHQVLHEDLPEPMGMIDCWREMFAVAREKEQHPQNEHAPCELEKVL